MEKYVKQFLLAVPLREIDWEIIISELSIDEEQQKTFIKQTVALERNLKYPVNLAYQRAFIKKLMKSLEERNVSIDDIFYEAYGNLVSKSDEKYCYKHYVGNEIMLSFKETVPVISSGTTGLSTWEAGLVLTEWCLQNKSKIEGKTVLELGSGTGLTGIITAFVCKTEEMYLSDCHIDVLENLKDNVTLNKHQSTKINVISLDWTEISTKEATKYAPDLIIAADVVYDSDLFPALVRTISTFINDTSKECTMILACTERNPETLNKFLNILGMEVEVESIKPPNQQNLQWSSKTLTRMFLISKRKFI